MAQSKAKKGAGKRAWSSHCRQVPHVPSLRSRQYAWADVLEWLDNNTIQRTDDRGAVKVSDQKRRDG